jgi:hypothetical protein
MPAPVKMRTDCSVENLRQLTKEQLAELAEIV